MNHAQMMQERDIVFTHWDPSKSSKRSSGFFSVLKWFRNNESTPPPPPDLVHSASSSCSSVESVFSTDTVASFSFVSPNSYRPFGAAIAPEKCILSGPETHTYRARIAQREVRRENDRDLTLRSKYNLYKAAEPDRGHSLPLMTKAEETKRMHRRTASESSKHRKAGVYLHVKGKRKAPQPPGEKGEGTLRRKKRMAPQPPANPDVICNDSLKLDRGILKSAKQQTENKVITVQEVTQVAPRPWYKRTISNKNSATVVEKKTEPEKRKSGNLSFLTNISELDREAMEILERETLKMKYLRSSQQAPAFMRPRGGEHTRTNSDSWVTPKRKSARDLIAKFNAITGVSKSSRDSTKAQTPPIQEVPTKQEFVIPVIKEVPTTSIPPPEPKRSLPNSPVLRTSATKQITRTQWNCPRCTLENDYWRIICRVCSAIKPYFDDFTTEKVQENKEKKDKIEGLSSGNNGLKISDLQRSVFQSNYPKISLMETKREGSPKENGEVSSNIKVSEATKLFQPRYPRLNANLDRYFQKQTSEPAKDKDKQEMKYEVQKSASQPRISIFDYEKMVDKPKDRLPRSNILEEILKEMKKKEEQNKIAESKLEKIAFGMEIGFKKPEEKPIEINKQQKQIDKIDIKPNSDKAKIEKMILGDVIHIEKPQYINILSNEKTDINKDVHKTDKNKPDAKEKNQIVEKMILGDELKVSNTKFEKLEIQTSINQKPKEESGAIAKIVGVQLKSDNKPSEEERKNSAKKEERDKLKKMLIEMKNSLPKRQSNKTKDEQKNRVSIVAEEQTEPEEIQQPKEEEKTAELIIVTTETIYENIKAKRTEHPKPIKVSSSAQTNAVVRKNPTPSEANAIKQSNFQLIGAKDFVGITNEKTANDNSPHTYANLKQTSVCKPVVSKVFAGRTNTDTLEINRLLRRLEGAIAGGELGQAAIFARELAQLKVPCSVVRQKSEDKDEKKKDEELINIDMYVEDKVSHRGPFPLQVTPSMTVAELRLLVQEKYKIPAGVQRWILGKRLAAEDTATLEDHQVATSGCPVFLYLVAPANDTKLETSVLEIVEVNNLDQEEPTKLESPIVTEPPIVLQHQQPIVNHQPIEIEEAAAFVDTPIQRLVDQVSADQSANQEDLIDDVWKCPACTLLNPLVTNECEVCGQIRNDEIDQLEGATAVVNTNETYLKLVDLDNEDLVRNTEGFECLVCLAECQKGDGVLLRECLHQFCRPCLANTVEFCEEAEVKCPYRDLEYACDIALQDREVKALVSPAVYERHLARSVKQAETRMDNAFHCKTPDCKGWCVFEDNVNDFRCPVCRKINCLTCQAIHAGMNCKQYQEHMESQSETDEEARRTRDMLEDMVRRGEALTCPTCQVVLMKKWGCDWLRCSMCKTEICWVTRGPRWGVGGKGDTSGGCKCGVNGNKCHPKCNYCH